MPPNPQQLAEEAQALRTAGRLDEAIEKYLQIVLVAPTNAAAEHNLAAALGDAGRWREAEPHLRQAFAKGLDAPETWLVFARTLQTLHNHDEAEDAFRQAIRRKPTMHAAHRELAQLRWMRTGDAAHALKDLNAAIAAAPADPVLPLLKAQALEYADRSEDALLLLERLAAERPHDASVLIAAAQASVKAGKGAAAFALSERAYAMAPQAPAVIMSLAEASLAAGQYDRAEALAQAFLQRMPNDQHARALLATAWRLKGDPRYRALYDYDALVIPSQIDTPAGWPDLNAYLADLAEGLKAAHDFRTNPFGQSIRGGSQTADIFQSQHKAVRAVREALHGPIMRTIAKLGRGDDPLRARNLGGYAYAGIWSIRMGAGGFHTDHVHPQGWLSSACYIEVPRAMPGKEGWINSANRVCAPIRRSKRSTTLSRRRESSSYSRPTCGTAPCRSPILRSA